jgi:hypothetical protein
MVNVPALAVVVPGLVDWVCVSCACAKVLAASHAVITKMAKRFLVFIKVAS